MGWNDLIGQTDAVAAVRRAAETGNGLAHSWLITGPPGSGRSTLAYAFASALLTRPGQEEATDAQVDARTHPDLAVLSTEKVVITIEEVRKLVAASQFSPSVGRYRVIVIEDADRMPERTSNVLLKALEEPPERTIWILCAPSDADLLPTIRSRVRSVRLGIPTVDEVAELIARREGVPVDVAARAAREAQSHIGMARRLATDVEARRRRSSTLDLALGLRSVPSAVRAAAELLEVAGADAGAITVERDQRERDEVLRSLGVEPGGTIPPALRSQLKNLEEDQKRRATRSLRDGIDRILVDLLSLYRDVLLLQLGLDLDRAQLVNLAILDKLEAAAAACSAPQTLVTLDALAEARERITGNVAPALALEAALITAVRSRPSSGAAA